MQLSEAARTQRRSLEGCITPQKGRHWIWEGSLEKPMVAWSWLALDWAAPQCRTRRRLVKGLEWLMVLWVWLTLDWVGLVLVWTAGQGQT